MYSRRRERVGQNLKQEISRIILYELRDPRVGFVTVTEVQVAPDLKSVRVLVSVMGDARAQAQSLKGLQSAATFIQKNIGRRLHMRYTPAVKFVLDDSVKKSVHLSKVIRETLDESGGEEKV